MVLHWKFSILLATCLAAFILYNPTDANLLQLCEQIDHFKQFKWSIGCLEFADYGCFCGPGGWGSPVDNADACCQIHDHCYDLAEEKFMYCYPYVTYYHHKAGKCTEEKNTCNRFVCECDRALARCLIFKKYHSKYINYRYERGHCKTNKTIAKLE